jgi:hypothetical protein
LVSLKEAVTVVKCYNNHVKAFPFEGILALADLKLTTATGDDRARGPLKMEDPDPKLNPLQ